MTKYPELVDMLVAPDDDEEYDNKAKRKKYFMEVLTNAHLHFSSLLAVNNMYICLLLQYKSPGELAEGVKKGIYHQGIFYVNRSNLMEGFVSVEGFNEDILIQGRENLNRVINGDTVVIEMLPKEEWKSPSKIIVQSATAKSATGNFIFFAILITIYSFLTFFVQR